MAISPKRPESNKSNPIGFFEGFFTTDYLEDLKKDFFPDVNNPNNYWVDKPFGNIDQTNECFEYDIEKVIDWTKGEFENLSSPVTQWMTKKKCFKEVLSKVIYEYYKESKDIIAGLLWNDNNIERAELQISILIQKLTELLSICYSNKKFSKYEDCLLSLKGLIRFLYTDYKFACPEPSEDIKKILFEKDVDQVKFEEPKILKASFYNEILEVVDERDMTLLENQSNAKSNLLFLAGGNFELIEDMNFTWSQKSSYYVIRQIKTYNPKKYDIKKVCGTVTFKGKYVSESSFNKGCSIFSRTPSYLKEVIDNLVTSNLVSL